MTTNAYFEYKNLWTHLSGGHCECARDLLEHLLRAEAPAIANGRLGHGTPKVAVMRLGELRPAQHIALLLFGAVLQLEPVPVGPRVAEVRVQFDRAVQPLSRLQLTKYSTVQYSIVHTVYSIAHEQHNLLITRKNFIKLNLK